MAKQRINTIKNKILVQGDENLLTNNEILVTETPEGVSLKERTSEGIKTISGGGGGGEGNTIYAKMDFSLATSDIPEDDDALIMQFYWAIVEIFPSALYGSIGQGYSGNMVVLPWINLSLLGSGGYFNLGGANPYINEKYVGFFRIPIAFDNNQLVILNPYMSNFICSVVRAKQSLYFKIDLPKCAHYSRKSSIKDPKIDIIDIDITKISKYSDVLKSLPGIEESYPPEEFEAMDTLITIVSKEEVDSVFDMYCEMYFNG